MHPPWFLFVSHPRPPFSRFLQSSPHLPNFCLRRQFSIKSLITTPTKTLHSGTSWRYISSSLRSRRVTGNTGGWFRLACFSFEDFFSTSCLQFDPTLPYHTCLRHHHGRICTPHTAFSTLLLLVLIFLQLAAQRYSVKMNILKLLLSFLAFLSLVEAFGFRDALNAVGITTVMGFVSWSVLREPGPYFASF